MLHTFPRLPGRARLGLALVAAALVGATLPYLPAARAVRSGQPAPRALLDQACATDNPFMVTVQFGRGGSAGEPALVAFHDTPDDSAHSVLATVGEIGAAFGLAYNRASGSIFVAAYHKRGAPFGPGGPGAIYRYDSASGAVALWTTVPNAGPDSHAAAGNYYPDTAARSQVGRTSLGDIDLSEDGTQLFVTNLADRKIYHYRVADKQLLGSFEHGAARESWAADARPFGLKVRRGTLYHAVVNSAESSQKESDLGARIYASNLDGTGMREVAAFPLAFDRGQIDESAGTPAKWQPWKDGFCIIPNPGGSVNWNICPQPMLTDIEFAAGGDMLLGLRDRNGDMVWFVSDASQVPAGEGNGISGGDIMLARHQGDRWNAVTTPEYFAQDAGPGLGSTDSVHDETGFGGLAKIPNLDRVAMTGVTPITVLTGGAYWFDIATGTNGAREQLYTLDFNRNFGKANGLGDLEALCEAPTLCLGNTVWADDDDDGRFEPANGEAGIPGVTVILCRDADKDGRCSSGDVEVARSVTDADGGYSFCELPPGDYAVKVPAGEFAPGKPLAGRGSSTGNEVGGAAPDPDDDVDGDDNGSLMPDGAVCSRAVTLTVDGEPKTDGDADPSTNWTVDLGFSCRMCLGDTVFDDLDDDGRFEPAAGETGLDGVILKLSRDVNGNGTLDAGDGAAVAQVLTAGGGRYRFCDLAPGSYLVQVDPAAFMPGGALLGRLSSSGNETAGLAPDPDDDVDGDDNGYALAGFGVASRALSLGCGQEPTAAQDGDDASSNASLDFGFHKGPQSTATPGPSATTAPTPTKTTKPATATTVPATAVPATAVPTTAVPATPANGLCVPKVCPQLRDGIAPDVPQADIDAAMAKPESIAFWNQPSNPNKPVGPDNPRRCWLGIRNIGAPYAIPYNQLRWKSSCP